MTATNPPTQSTRKERVGTVIGDKMSKTIIVRIERRVRHPQFDKIITKSKKFYAHDAEEKAGKGDVVRIRETRPLSKLKRWELVEIIKTAQQQESSE
jgi:small subunit ribosomal protein S17